MDAKPFTPFLPTDWRAQYFVAAIIFVVVLASLIFVTAAVRTLGKQWSLQARVLEHHELIRRGPYRIVRHPIYTGMFGMLIASSLAYGHWVGLVVASVVYYFGTVMRIRSEEKLLREQFGSEYQNYAAASARVYSIWRDTRCRVPKILGNSGICLYLSSISQDACQRRGAGFQPVGKSRRLA